MTTATLDKPPCTHQIPLWKGGEIAAFALVDEQDRAVVGGWRWALSPKGYATRKVRLGGKLATVYLHKAIFGPELPDGHQVDHINRDKLDNRRANLRPVTPRENSQNVSSKGGASKYRGVCKVGPSWVAKANKTDENGRVRTHNLGYYSTELDAAAVAAQWRHQSFPGSVEDTALLAFSPAPRNGSV